MNDNQNNMKQMLENLPRFDYKYIRFFKKKEEMIKAIDDLRNNGYNNLVSRTLTDNYIREIYELYIFLPWEGIYPLFAGLIGGVIGAVIGWMIGSNEISIPLLNGALSGGKAVITILLGGIFGILSATFLSLLMLFKPINRISPGYHMLTIYDDAEKKKDINKIVNNYNAIEI